MSSVLPLTVYGPITPASPNVRVSGVLASADVSILENGNVIGNASAGAPGELLVGLSQKPTVGASIVAVQTTPEGTSAPTPYPIVVIDLPSPLPTPVIASLLNTCMSDVWVDGLVPGATVIAEIAGQPFAKFDAPRSPTWMNPDPSVGISAGSTLKIFQEVPGLAPSPTVESLPIPAFSLGRESRLPPPVLAQPLQACATSLNFAAVTPGAVTIVENEGQIQNWPSLAAAFNGYGGFPLRPGKLRAHQEMARCEFMGEAATYPVVATPPGPPTVTQDVCPDVRRLYLANLAPGGTLFLSRVVVTGPNVETTTPLGRVGIAYSTQVFDLPEDVALTDPAGPVLIRLTQSLCELAAPPVNIKVTAPPTPPGPITIVEPVWDCARALSIAGARVGALVQAFGDDGQPLSDAVPAPGPKFMLRTWFPLTAGFVLLVRQTGCGAGAETPKIQVKDLPPSLPQPRVVGPIRPGAASVTLQDVLPGARVFLLVDWKIRTAVDCWVSEPVIPVLGSPLTEEQLVFAVQTLCDKRSPLDGRGTPVARGRLRVTVKPKEVNRGESKPVIVNAFDADTGLAVVNAKALLDGSVVGTTGSAFTYSPGPTASPPAGIVRESVAYVDEPFTIQLLDPVWTILMEAAPAPAFIDQLRINVDSITWDVTPLWDPSKKSQIKSVQTPPNVHATVSLPKPPSGGNQAVQINLTMTYSTPGGYAQGIYVPPGTVTAPTVSANVVYDGNNKIIDWLLQVNYVTDQVSQISVTLVPTFYGIGDA